jgi:Plasmid pRiA4b ORF-3-like protein
VAQAKIARLKVTVKDIRPPIWRRLEVPLDFTFARLSDVILAAFGWTNSHLHEFELGRRRIGMPDPDEADWARAAPEELHHLFPQLDPQRAGLVVPPSLEDEARVTLAQGLASAVRRFLYRYDFGDDWRHLVQVEEVREAEAALTYPRCTAGRRAAPPEDCGGVWGYAHLLEVLADPAHDEYAELRDWCPYFQPEEFDLAAADEAVRHPPEYSG